MANKTILRQTAKLGANEYLTCLTGQQLADMYKEGAIVYNPDIQRGAKVKVNSKNEEVLKPIYSTKNVKKIEEEIISGRYCPDMITFNVMDLEEVEYVNHSLVIEDTMAILDGHHRIKALSNVAKKIKDSKKKNGNPDLYKNVDLDRLVFPIKITTYSLEKAQQQFYQFSLGLKISSSRAEYFNQKDIENTILKEVIEKSALKDKVEIVRNTIPKKEENKIVTFGTLVSALKKAKYLVENVDEKEDLTNYLVEFFNELFEIIPEFNNFESRNELKKTSLLPENIMFYGFLALSKEIKGDPNWKDVLRTIRSIDLDKDSDNWVSKVTKQGANGYSIINSNDSRDYLSTKFIKLVKERNSMLAE